MFGFLRSLERGFAKQYLSTGLLRASFKVMAIPSHKLLTKTGGQLLTVFFQQYPKKIYCNFSSNEVIA